MAEMLHRDKSQGIIFENDVDKEETDRSLSPRIDVSSFSEKVLQTFQDDKFKDDLKPVMTQMMSDFIHETVANKMKAFYEIFENHCSVIESLTEANKRLTDEYKSNVDTLISSERRLIRQLETKLQRNPKIPLSDNGRRMEEGTETEQNATMKVEIFKDDTLSTENVRYPTLAEDINDKFMKSTWRNLADQEINEGRKEGVGQRHGTHAVLCIDTSGSMNDGSAWSQVKQFYDEFLDAMNRLKDQDAHHDNIAVVTFGSEVKVQKRLTKQLSRLKGVLDDVTPRGPSPIFGGLVMAAAAVQTSKFSFAIVNNMHVRPKIILVSDGNPTEISKLDGPDVADPKKIEQAKNEIFEEVSKLRREQIDLHCIYVGKNADRAFLENLQAESVKELMSYRDGEKMALYTVLKCMHEGDQRFVRCAGEDGIMRPFGTQAVTDVEQLFNLMKQLPKQGAQNTSDFLQLLSQMNTAPSETTINFPDSDFPGRSRYKTSTITLSGDRLVNVYSEINDGNHPPVGTRVERDEDWMWGNQDNGKIGTIIGHITDPDEEEGQCWVQVEWDNDSSPEKGKQNVYRFKMNEDMESDVRPSSVEDRIPPKGKVLAVGCRVIPGDGFNGDPDNKKGTVIRLHGNKAEVKWDDGSRDRYKFGSRASEIVPILDPDRTAVAVARTNNALPRISAGDVPKIKLTERLIQKIALTIPSGWEALGTELGIGNVKMSHIAKDHHSSIARQIVSMLSNWNITAANPTLDVLVKAIRESGVQFDNGRLEEIIRGCKENDTE